jgi:hypothetical protein
MDIGEDVSGWFKSHPLGTTILVTVEDDVEKGDTEVVLVIEAGHLPVLGDDPSTDGVEEDDFELEPAVNIPAGKSSKALKITIPKNKLSHDGKANIVVEENEDAVWAIEPASE